MTEPSPPLASATVVLLSRSEPFEVFLVRRHSRSRFMGGVTVFPGGKCDEADSAPATEALCVGVDRVRAAAVLGDLDGACALGHYVAAVRETFEEANVLLAVDALGRPIGVSDRLTEARAALQRGERTLASVALEMGFRLDLGGLRYFDHWITPTIERRRFTARFFVATLPPGQTAAHDARETTHGSWMTPAVALGAGRDGDIRLAPPTLRTLEWLDGFRAAEDVLRACPDRPVPVRLPQLVTGPEGRPMLALPGDPLHPIEPGQTHRRFWNHEGRWLSRWDP